MKKSIVLIAVLVSGIAMSVFSQDPPKSPKVTTEGVNAKVVYGQPSKRGRVIFGDLVPYGQVWRTGAHEATEITFTKDAVFGGKDVKAGTYSLFTIPQKDKWTIILNSKLGQWGAYEYEKIKSSDVLKTDINVITLKESVEKLTYSFDAKGLAIAWDMTSVFIPIGFK